MKRSKEFHFFVNMKKCIVCKKDIDSSKPFIMCKKCKFHGERYKDNWNNIAWVDEATYVIDNCIKNDI